MRFTVQRYSSVPLVADAHPRINGIKSAASADTILEGQPAGKVYKTEKLESCSQTQTPTPSIGESSACSVDQEIFEPVARRGREYAKRQRERLVNKTGEVNISQTNVQSKNKRFFIDIFTTAVDMQWRYSLLTFGLSFLCSWLIFAFAWWVICIANGDDKNRENPCVDEVYDFRTALLFSIETQHTIGYGSRAMMPKCPEAIIVLMLQSCIGVFIQSLMTGIIFAKLSRPKRRSQTIMFSKNAVICQRDGEYCLLLRVADMRKSYIVEAIVRALVVKRRITKEGESIPLCQYPLHVESETSLVDSYVFLACPCTVMHRIDKDSPLWEVSAENLISEQFEIIVILEGTIESTGMTVQVRTSYLPSEILWGHRLSPLLTYQKENGEYKIDYGQFHNTIPTTMPEVSAKDFHAGSETTQPPPAKGEDFPFNFTSSGPHNKHDKQQKRMNSVIRRVLSLKRRRGSSPSPSCTTVTSLSNGRVSSVTDVAASPGSESRRKKGEVPSRAVEETANTDKVLPVEPIVGYDCVCGRIDCNTEGGVPGKVDVPTARHEGGKHQTTLNSTDSKHKEDTSKTNKMFMKNGQARPDIERQEQRQGGKMAAQNGDLTSKNGHFVNGNGIACQDKTVHNDEEDEQNLSLSCSLSDQSIALG